MNAPLTVIIPKRTLDVGLCMDVMDQVWDEVSEDGIEEFIPDVITEYWVKMEETGLYRIHRLNAITYQIHALILPEHRERGKETGIAILKWCVDNFDFNKLIAEIPMKYPNVYHFTKHQGFKDEGINRQSFLKGGKIWDTWRLGILKEEIWLKQ